MTAETALLASTRLTDVCTGDQDAYKYASQTLKRNWTDNLRVGVTGAFDSHTGAGTWKGERQWEQEVARWVEGLREPDRRGRVLDRDEGGAEGARERSSRADICVCWWLVATMALRRLRQT